MAYFFLLLYLGLLFLRPQEWMTSIHSWRLPLYTMLAAGGAWLITLPQNRWKLSSAPQNYLMLGFFASTVASHLLRVRPYFGAALEAFATIGKLTLVYFMMVSILNSVRRIRALLIVLSIGILFMCAHSILQAKRGYGFGYMEPIYQRDSTPVVDPMTGETVSRAYLISRTMQQDQISAPQHQSQDTRPMALRTGEAATGEQTSPQRQGPVIGSIMRVRAFGFFNDPNDLALIIVAAIPFFLRVVLRRESLLRGRIFALLCIIPLVITVLLTRSRGGWLALAVMLGTFVAVHMGGKRMKITLALGAVLFVLIVALAPGRMGSFDAKEASARGRWAAWGDGMQMLKQNPLTGVGYGRFSEFTEQGIVAHNSFVHCYGELGLLGYFFFLALLAASVRDGLVLSQTTKLTGEEGAAVKDLARAGLPGLAGFLAASFFLSRTYVQPLYVFIAFFACLRTVSTSMEPAPALDGLYQPRHWRTVAAMELGSIVMIYMMTRALMN